MQYLFLIGGQDIHLSYSSPCRQTTITKDQAWKSED